MKIREIYGIIRNKKGSSFPLIVAVALVLAMILCGVSEYMRLIMIAQGVRDAVQSAVVSTVNDNYDDIYHGVREGYAGGYQLVGASWEDSVDYGDIYAYLDKTLGLQKSGGYHVKYAGESVEYKLSGLSVDIRNAPLAPSDPAGVQGFLVDAAIRLEVPVSFGGKILPPMGINLRVRAKYMSVF
ncbi:MAG: hypothetical protein NUV45_00185 [Tepidanaerobacteraceae bacterium]|nr:hypothetical protein [Tepidanaerobacteraceae bacterium]